MAEGETTAPVVPETTPPAETTGETTIVGTDTGNTTAAPAADTASTTPPPPAPAADWKDRRIAEQTAKRRQAEQRVKELEDQIQAAVPPTSVKSEDPAEFDRRVDAAAQQRTAAVEFNRQCETAATAGRAAYPDFDSRVNELVTLVDRNDPESVARYNLFLAAALETGDAPKIIHQLGGDKNEADRLLRLPPVKMAVELTRMAAREPQQISGAPKPISPVGGRGIAHTAIDPTDPDRSDNLTTAAWMERRAKQVAERSARG